jgi:hypothetical protein
VEIICDFVLKIGVSYVRNGSVARTYGVADHHNGRLGRRWLRADIGLGPLECRLVPRPVLGTRVAVPTSNHHLLGI